VFSKFSFMSSPEGLSPSDEPFARRPRGRAAVPWSSDRPAAGKKVPRVSDKAKRVPRSLRKAEGLLHLGLKQKTSRVRASPRLPSRRTPNPTTLGPKSAPLHREPEAPRPKPGAGPSADDRNPVTAAPCANPTAEANPRVTSTRNPPPGAGVPSDARGTLSSDIARKSTRGP
jgi:hypothetical protein